MQAVIPGPAVDDVLARAALNGVVAAAAVYGVAVGLHEDNAGIGGVFRSCPRLVSPLDDVGALVSCQDVSKGGAGQILDSNQRVALGIASGRRAVGQIHENLSAGSGVARRVAAGRDAGFAAACQAVPAGAANQSVVARAARQGVVSAQAAQRLAAASADDRVIAAAAIERLVGFIARQTHARGDAEVRGIKNIVVDIQNSDRPAVPRHRGVVRVGPFPDRHLGIEIRHALQADLVRAVDEVVDRIAAMARAEHERVRAAAAGQRVVSGAAGKRVRPVPAVQRVPPAPALKGIGNAVAGQAIVVARADQVLYRQQGVASRVSIAGLRGSRGQRQAHGHSCAGSCVGCGVDARPAMNPVAASAPFNDIGALVAGQRVGASRADQVLDSRQRVAHGVAAACGAHCEIHVHASGRAGVGRGVAARAAVDAVHSGAALQQVVAVAASQRVAAVPALQGVVAAASAQAVRARAAGQAVAALAAVKRVAARAAGQRVRPGQAGNLVVAVPAGEKRVIVRAARDSVVEVEILRAYRR